jgi:hypothetical protein
MTPLPPEPDPDDPLFEDVPDEPPPFLGTWNRVYAAIVVYLVAVIAGFHIFSRIFAP